MATGSILLPIPGFFDDTNPPGLSFANSKPRVLFDDGTNLEAMHWTFRMPQDYASAPVAKIQYAMASATTAEVIMRVYIMALSDGDAAAYDSDSYDTANASSATTVPGTAGHIDEISITLTNADSVAAGDWVAVKLDRSDAAGDDASGDLELIAFSIEYTTS